MAQKTIKIGEYAVGQAGDQIFTILGSCVGIAVLWRERGIYGLTHSLLYDSVNSIKKERRDQPAKYIDDALRYVLRDMGVEPADMGQLEAYVGGGASLMSDSHGVGRKNVQSAMRELNKVGIPITGRCTGGDYGRTMTVDCTTGEVSIEKLYNTHKKAGNA